MRTQPNKANTSPTKTKKHKFSFLDSTGSMDGPKYGSAVEGVRNDLQVCKDLEFNSFTLVEFVQGDSIYTTAWTDLSKVEFNFHGAIGHNTPLYQAIGFTLEKALQEIPKTDAVLFNVFSDGGHNHNVGKYHNPDEVVPLIKQCEERGWTVTFVGTENDTDNMIRALKLSKGNTLVHDNTGEGVKMSFQVQHRATTSYSKSVDLGESVVMDFYSKVLNEETND